MTGYIIFLPSDKSSKTSARAAYHSHQEAGNSWPLEGFSAATPKDVDEHLRDLGIRDWTWPWEKQDICPITGLHRHPYKTRNRNARRACFASHARLWFRCATGNEPIMIFEEDCVFARPLAPESLLSGLRQGWGCVGLNDPRGATRRAGAYHAACRNQGPDQIIEVPWVDKLEIPQGLAGNSAYMITPWAAKLVLEKAREVGGWPNDALLCRQLFPWLAQSTTFYTKVSGRMSGLA